MSFTPSQVLRSLAFAALMAAWAVAGYYGASGRGNPDFNTAFGIAPIGLTLVVLLWRVRHPLLLAGGALVLAGTLAGLWPTLRANFALLYFVEHLGINLALGTLFGRTLIGPGEALVTRLARTVHTAPLSPRHVRYTRAVTRMWAIFFLGNAAVSALIFALAPIAVWSLYANLLTGPMIGVMFIGESLWRLRALPPEERPSIAEMALAWRQRASTKRS
jgi:uncharacterized membrane protein